MKIFERLGSWFHEVRIRGLWPRKALPSLSLFHPYMDVITFGYDHNSSDSCINYTCSLGYQSRFNWRSQTDIKYIGRAYGKELASMIEGLMRHVGNPQGRPSRRKDWNSPTWAETLSTGGISCLKEVSALLLQSFDRLNQAHPGYLK